MRKTIYAFLAIGLLVVISIREARAGTIDLFEYAFNIDGSISNPKLGDPVPGAANVSAFDDQTGLGTISITVMGAGIHYVAGFFDHEIDEAATTFFDEYGAAFGSPAAEQSWEIDEPGYVFGDIYTNFTTGSLDGANGVPSGDEDDVSMAIGWDFALSSGEKAVISFRISGNAPAGGFYLTQTDPGLSETIYFSSTLGILTIPSGEVVPLPSAALLTLPALVLLVAARQLRRRK